MLICQFTAKVIKAVLENFILLVLFNILCSSLLSGLSFIKWKALVIKAFNKAREVFFR